jgi:hypothetical protein
MNKSQLQGKLARLVLNMRTGQVAGQLSLLNAEAKAQKLRDLEIGKLVIF